MSTTEEGDWTKLPPVEQAKKWQQLVPDSAERMFRELEKDFSHRRRLELIRVGLQFLGALLGSGALVGYLWLAKYYLDHGEATAGAGILGSGAVAAAGLFVGRKLGRRD